MVEQTAASTEKGTFEALINSAIGYAIEKQTLDVEQAPQLKQEVIEIINKYNLYERINHEPIAILLAFYKSSSGDAIWDIAYYVLKHFSDSYKCDCPDESLIRVIRRSGIVLDWMPHKINQVITTAYHSIADSVDINPTILAKFIQDVINTSSQHGKRSEQDGFYYLPVEVINALVYTKSYVHDNIGIKLLGIEYIKNFLNKIDDTQTSEGLPAYKSRKVRRWVDNLRVKLDYALTGLSMIDHDLDSLLERLLKSVSKEDLDNTNAQLFWKAVLLNAKALTEYGYDYGILAARLMLMRIYETVLGWDALKHGIEKIDEFHRLAFRHYIKKAIKLKLLDKRVIQKYTDDDLDGLAIHLSHVHDFNSSIHSVQVLYDRYLLGYRRGDERIIIETPQFFWMRVAIGQFLLEEDKEKSLQYTILLFDKYVKRLFCSSTPTLFNSCTPKPQLSSCYVYMVDDSIESIFQRGIADCAYLSKWAGGLGGSWTKVRGRGALISGTNGKSNGVIPFLKIHNDMLVAVNQGGKRNGSGAVYIEPWHNDVFDFIQLRRNTGDERLRTHDTNTALWIPDLFMKQVINRGQWYLFRSNEVSELHDLYGKAFEEKYYEYVEKYKHGLIYGQEIDAIDLWREILKMLYETGHPWITFKDPCNIANPQSHVGVIHSSNLCTEITLNTSNDEIAVCNLGSLMLDYFVEDGKINYDLLKETIYIAIRALDNVIDVNFYPVKEARDSNKRHRPIGLGVGGWHNMLYKLGIPFDSETALELSNEIMEFISYHSIIASVMLAKEKGAYPTYKGSKWEQLIMTYEMIDLIEAERGQPVRMKRYPLKIDWDYLRAQIRDYGIRNSHITAIAPTATISIIMDTSPSIEPLFSNMYVKSNLSGDFFVINRFLERYIREKGLWPKFKELLKYFDGDAIAAAYAMPDLEKEVKHYIGTMFKTAFQINPQVIIDQAAVRQRWVTQSQSVNIFYDGNDIREISNIYKYAWECGLKTTYYFRTTASTRIEKSTVERDSIPTYTTGSTCRIDDEDCEVCQ
jgi:ribonucleoside-diphosphate reductase alpha chain